jgi:hypothetical protein
MANQSHVQMLLQRAPTWNKWGAAHPAIRPDLSGAYLTGADRRGGHDARDLRASLIGEVAHIFFKLTGGKPLIVGEKKVRKYEGRRY